MRTLIVLLSAAILLCGCGDDDAAPEDLPTFPETCEQFYGDAPTYTLCEATSTTCQFWFQTEERATEVSCDELCGGQCLGANDDVDRAPCTIGNSVSCSGGDEANLADGVCLCSRSAP